MAHLLLPSAWLAAHVAAAAVHAYALLWLLGWALGPRAYRHRVARGTLVVRNGALYRARVPLEDIVAITPRRQAVGGTAGVVLRDGAALLPARRRVDVWLELSRPVTVERPLGEPVSVTRLALAADDPPAVGAAVAAAGRPGAGHRRRHLAVWDGATAADAASGALAGA